MLVAVHPSEVLVKAVEPLRLIVSAAVAEPPAFLSVNVCDAVCPGVTAP
jgi:hypothetical protein